MKNWLHDVVKHTKPFELGKRDSDSFGMVYVQPDEDRTKIYAVSDDKQVVMFGETDKCLFEGSTGWGLQTTHLEKYLTSDALGVDPVISCEYKMDNKKRLYPSQFLFSSASGTITACHRNSIPEVAKIYKGPKPKFNKPILSIELSPNVLDRFSSLTKLKDWTSKDTLVQMYLQKGSFLVVSGDHSTLENTRVVLQQDIDIADTHKWNFPLDLLNKALSVSGDKTLHFYNGLLEIYCESYFSQWRYCFPAQAK